MTPVSLRVTGAVGRAMLSAVSKYQKICDAATVAATIVASSDAPGSPYECTFLYKMSTFEGAPRPIPPPLAVEATDVDYVHDDPGGGFDARDAIYDAGIGVSTRAAVRRRARAVVRPRRRVEEERISQCRRGRWRGR